MVWDPVQSRGFVLFFFFKCIIFNVFFFFSLFSVKKNNIQGQKLKIGVLESVSVLDYTGSKTHKIADLLILIKFLKGFNHRIIYLIISKQTAGVPV